MWHLLFWISFLLIFYQYLGYPLTLLFLSWVRKPDPVRSEDITPSVSLIISAYNEEEVIRRKIENALALDYPADKLEIIVASDGSTDQTCEIAREYAQRGVVLMHSSERRGKNGALNDVAPRARGDLIVFTDANGMFQRDALRVLMRPFADPRVGCVCGELLYVSASDNLVAKGYDVYWSYDQQLKRLESRLSCLLGANGSIFAIKKDLYRPLRGDVCNDMVLSIQIAARGYNVIYEPAAISLEAGSLDAGEELGRRSRIIGRGLVGIRTVLPDILHGKRWLLLWELFSRKLLRYCTPFCFLALAVANLFLWNGLYAWTLAAQGVFYASALLSFVLRRYGVHLRILSVPHYFVVGNIAALQGWAKVLGGRELTRWETVDRAYDQHVLNKGVTQR